MYQKTSENLDIVLEKITNDFWATIYQLKVSFVWAHIKRLVDENQGTEQQQQQQQQEQYFVGTNNTLAACEQENYKLKCLNDIVIKDMRGRDVSSSLVQREQKTLENTTRFDKRRRTDTDTDKTRTDKNPYSKNRKQFSDKAVTTDDIPKYNKINQTENVSNNNNKKPVVRSRSHSPVKSLARSRSQSPKKRPAVENKWSVRDKYDSTVDVTPTEKKIINEIIEDITLKKIDCTEKQTKGRKSRKNSLNTMGKESN